jgi:hypothetical protein
MRAPVRAWFVVTPALNGSETVHVHVIFLDIPFMNHERLFLACDGFVLPPPVGSQSLWRISCQMANDGELATDRRGV